MSILSGIENLYYGFLLLALLAIALNFVLVKLGIVELEKQDEEEE